MMAELNIKKTLERNPQIDEEMLRRYREVLEMFRKLRTSRKRYELASPVDPLPIGLPDENATDSRTIDLSFLNAK